MPDDILPRDGPSRWIIQGNWPDDTWILRPQDLPEGFRADGDTWYFSRVCGTFGERAGWHGCQMPERLLGRIIRACSNDGDFVLDPFAGSGTTPAVAKKLKRRFLGFETSRDYAERVRSRLRKIKPGDPLEGAADPLTSVPSTAEGRKLSDVKRGPQGKRRRRGPAKEQRSLPGFS